MAKKRQSIEIPGVSHGAPIPCGAKVGNMLFSSGIMGRDPATGELPDDPYRQAEFAFQNLRTMLEIAGATTDDIGHMSVMLKDLSYRDAVNKPWLEMFPDEHDRPARHATQADLPGGMLVQLEIIAVLD
jgi:2-iminobutanoate/2-iminopropanoate deaminase